MRSNIGIVLLLALSVMLSGCASSTKPTGLVGAQSFPAQLMVAPESPLQVLPGTPGEELEGEVQRAMMAKRWRDQLLLLQEWVHGLYDNRYKVEPP